MLGFRASLERGCLVEESLSLILYTYPKSALQFIFNSRGGVLFEVLLSLIVFSYPNLALGISLNMHVYVHVYMCGELKYHST